ncbi:nitroreductase [Sphingomonas naphthae]|uniref:Putative NAD(P)H nitroreductase n=1 Tax=Sphingomonas naphthae TaxID=1813468 RepID=A0ABY7TGW8_9SPHN|nr:nitroreductase [Sphingomonas naphthae]WCT72098.1 nitroreductase [Sphingomonas naphthae]
MFNDTATAATLLATRRSGKPRDMVAPGPDAAQMRRILEAAIRVPDHGKLAPWRFLTIADAAREDFAALLRDAYIATKPGPGRVELQAIEDFAHQAPALVIAIFAPVTTSHIPLWEQELSCGAACMNLLTATHAEGLVGGWLTGWATYSEAVAAGLGLTAHEKIAGFLFLGTPSRDLEERPRPDYDKVVAAWPADGPKG